MLLLLNNSLRWNYILLIHAFEVVILPWTERITFCWHRAFELSLCFKQRRFKAVLFDSLGMTSGLLNLVNLCKRFNFSSSLLQLKISFYMFCEFRTVLIWNLLNLRSIGNAVRNTRSFQCLNFLLWKISICLSLQGTKTFGTSSISLKPRHCTLKDGHMHHDINISEHELLLNIL